MSSMQVDKRWDKQHSSEYIRIYEVIILIKKFERKLKKIATAEIPLQEIDVLSQKNKCTYG